MASDDGGADWRRLASDRNVSHGVARALWEQAHAAAPDDPAQAEHAFHLMLAEAEAANVTHEPGRETLSSAAPSARDASALGPGKWTRVLLEQPKPNAAAVRAAANARPSAERLRNELASAGQAGKLAAAMLATSDGATIVEALRELGDRAGPGVLQKVMGVASGAVERMLDNNQRAKAGPQAPAQATATGHAAPPATSQAAQAAQAQASQPRGAAPAAGNPARGTTASTPAAPAAPANRGSDRRR